MNPTKILVVDDDRMARQMAEHILKQGKHEVYSVGSGEEAIAVLEEDDYGLVFLDVNMPGMDGVETLRNIRKMDERKKDIPVIFLTADESDSTASSASSLNTAGYIKKPFLPKDLLSWVEKIFV